MEAAANAESMNIPGYLEWLMVVQSPGQSNSTLNTHARKFLFAFRTKCESSADSTCKSFRIVQSASEILRFLEDLKKDARKDDKAFKSLREVEKVIEDARGEANDFDNVRKVGEAIIKTRDIERDKEYWIEGCRAAISTASDPYQATKSVFSFVLSRLLSPPYAMGRSMSASLKKWIPTIVDLEEKAQLSDFPY